MITPTQNSFNQPKYNVNFSKKEEEEDVSNILAQIDDYDKKMLGYLLELHNATGKDVLNINKFENVVQALQHINAENEYDYLNSLLHPEQCKGVKIPSPIPVPSCAFQLHNTITLSTNSSGNLCFLFNPFFLYNQTLIGKTFQANSSTEGITKYASSFIYNNNDQLNGHSPLLEGWKSINIGQGIPNVYNQYRLVSASVVVRYIGRMDITSGVIGGAIIYDESIFPILYCQPNEGIQTDMAVMPIGLLQKYGNFDLAMDSFYHQETNSINGLREIYFPLDNTYEEYTKAIGDIDGLSTGSYGSYDTIPYLSNTGKCGFQQMVYILGAPPSSSCFKIDIYCNFETLPNAEFLNYMPISLTPKTISPEIKKQSISIVQQSPITDLNTKTKWFGDVKKGIFSGLKKIWKTGIPKKILTQLTPYIMPYFKPALSLYNMFQSNEMGNVNNSFQSINPTVTKMINNAEADDGNKNVIMNID